MMLGFFSRPTAAAVALLAVVADGARVSVRRGGRQEIISRSRSPLSLLRPSDIIVAESGSELLGFMQCALIGSGFLFLADDLEVAQLEADDEQTRCLLAKQGIGRLPTSKRLWWFGPPGDASNALKSAGFVEVPLAETVRALWPALAFFGTPIFLLPAIIFAFPLLPQSLAFIDELGTPTRIAIAAAPPVLTVALAGQSLLGKTVLSSTGSRR